MWNSIISVLDHCLFIYFIYTSKIRFNHDMSQESQTDGIIDVNDPFLNHKVVSHATKANLSSGIN